MKPLLHTTPSGDSHCPKQTLDIHSLGDAVRHYFTTALADSTHKTYRTSKQRYCKFCVTFSLKPFPTTENMLCYFVACLGQQGLAHSTIKHYFDVKAVDSGTVSYFACQIPTLPSTIASCLHSAGACPPHWVFQGFVALGLTHPCLRHLKWL